MKQKYLILFAIMVISTMLFFYLSSQSIRTKAILVGAYDIKIKEEQEKLNSAKVLNEQLKQVSQVIMNSMTNEKTYNPEETNKFSKKLADLADKYKIALHSFFPKIIATGGTNLLEQQYTMELVCTYVQLGQLLTDLEGYNYIINIKTLEVKPAKSDKQNIETDEDLITRYKVTLEVSTYKIVKEA
ncbi:MAG: hypothetical protein H8E57_07120 [Candidatus Cloacimonetes bacterium]|nr:hypothetical protein [Candidatus Cloacimonadota bacterium]